MSTVVYDAGVLVAADRNERRAWAEHKARLEFGVVPLVPAAVVAHVLGAALAAVVSRAPVSPKSWCACFQNQLASDLPKQSLDRSRLGLSRCAADLSPWRSA